MILNTGKVYDSFAAKNGEILIVRCIRWEDLEACLEFANESRA